MSAISENLRKNQSGLGRDLDRIVRWSHFRNVLGLFYSWRRSLSPTGTEWPSVTRPLLHFVSGFGFALNAAGGSAEQVGAHKRRPMRDERRVKFPGTRSSVTTHSSLLARVVNIYRDVVVKSPPAMNPMWPSRILTRAFQRLARRVPYVLCVIVCLKWSNCLSTSLAGVSQNRARPDGPKPIRLSPISSPSSRHALFGAGAIAHDNNAATRLHFMGMESRTPV